MPWRMLGVRNNDGPRPPTMRIGETPRLRAAAELDRERRDRTSPVCQTSGASDGRASFGGALGVPEASVRSLIGFAVSKVDKAGPRRCCNQGSRQSQEDDCIGTVATIEKREGREHGHQQRKQKGQRERIVGGARPDVRAEDEIGGRRREGVVVGIHPGIQGKRSNDQSRVAQAPTRSPPQDHRADAEGIHEVEGDARNVTGCRPAPECVETQQSRRHRTR